MFLTTGSIRALQEGAKFPANKVTAVDSDDYMCKPGHITKSRYVPNQDGVFEQEFNPVLWVVRVCGTNCHNTKFVVTDGEGPSMVMMISNRKFKIKKAFWDNYRPDANYNFVHIIPASIFMLSFA